MRASPAGKERLSFRARLPSRFVSGRPPGAGRLKNGLHSSTTGFDSEIVEVTLSQALRFFRVTAGLFRPAVVCFHSLGCRSEESGHLKKATTAVFDASNPALTLEALLFFFPS